MNTIDKVKQILSELSGIEDIHEDNHLQSDLGLDSIQLVSLLIMIEESFDIILDESDMNPFDLAAVHHVVSMVEKYIGGETDGN